ncbi:MAG: DUF4129 domain-containing protein [Candidatus Thermoplasmatota archaeon]|nr:DUF4129 domain-containing protein [Candidatus Thermoplasmatota archaeon]
MDRKTVIGMTIFLFLAAAWLIGAMMNFQYDTSPKEVDLSFLPIIVAVIPFIMTGIIFYKGRTRMFLFLFSFALFWIITPVFFKSLTVLYFALILLGSILLFFALKKGYINSKKVAMMTAFLIWLGGLLFYLYYDKYQKALYKYSYGSYGMPTEIKDSFTYVWDETGGSVESVGGPGLLILVMISLLALGFFTYQKLRPVYLFDSVKEDDEEQIESEITSTVDEAINNLHDGKDVESTILRCYQSMCRILEEEGVENEDFMTPREFEMIANKKLTISSSKISNIREIFELAKYSSHELGEKEKNRALEDLKGLREELDR